LAFFAALLIVTHRWVSVGIDHDIAEFATDSVLAWWETHGVQ
jgi:hypothetical protein